MKQADLGLNLRAKRTRKREFLDEMNCVVPWADLVRLVTPFALEGRKGRPPFAVETMFRHLLQKHKLAAQILASINDMRDKGLMLPAARWSMRTNEPTHACT